MNKPIIRHGIEVLPCPFCGGGKDSLILSIISRPYNIQCITCNTWGPSDARFTKIDAIAAWNKRISKE